MDRDRDRDAAVRKRKKNAQDQAWPSSLSHSSSSQAHSPPSYSHQQHSFSFSQPSRSSSSYSHSHSPSESQSESHSRGRHASNWDNAVTQQLGRSLYGFVCYLWDLLLGTLLILRPLFSLLLALIMIILLLAVLTRSLVGFRSEVQQRIVCKIPLVSYFINCPSYPFASYSDPAGGMDPMRMPIPDFADLVNKQAASYELIADSLSLMNPAMIRKAAKKAKTKGKGLFGSRTGKGTHVKDQGQGIRIPGIGGGHDGDQEENDDDDDEYGLTVHSQRGGLPLPLLLKRAELAVVDLKVLVKHSSLPEESKGLLVQELQAFHTRAKTTSRQLQFLQARANGCVDGLVIRNIYLTLELDRLEEQQKLLKGGGNAGGGGGGGGGGAGVWDKVMDFFSGSHDLQVAASERKLQQLYRATMEDARNHVRDLILQAQEALQSLDTLDTILSTIHEIAIQETRTQTSAHEETLALLWSRLGGNRLERGFYRENLDLLKNMEGQRKATVGQIQAALWKLTDFEAEIGILREKIVDAAVDATADQGPPMIKAPSGDGDSVEGEGAGGGGGLGASSLRAHIQQIDLVTSRLKDRSFLADAMVKAQAERIPGMARVVDGGDMEAGGSSSSSSSSF